MDRITVEAAKTSYGEEFPFIFVNGERLDSMLARLVDKGYRDLIPSWLCLRYGEMDGESEYIESRMTLDDGVKILPILLCPDDFDFSCTTVVVEVVPGKDEVVWRRMGVDTTGSPPYIGETVEWFPEVASFRFDRRQYLDCLAYFKALPGS